MQDQVQDLASVIMKLAPKSVNDNVPVTAESGEIAKESVAPKNGIMFSTSTGSL